MNNVFHLLQVFKTELLRMKRKSPCPLPTLPETTPSPLPKRGLFYSMWSYCHVVQTPSHTKYSIVPHVFKIYNEYESHLYIFLCVFVLFFL